MSGWMGMLRQWRHVLARTKKVVEWLQRQFYYSRETYEVDDEVLPSEFFHVDEDFGRLVAPPEGGGGGG